MLTHHDPCVPLATAGGGRELVAALNFEVLQATYGESLLVVTVKRRAVEGAGAVLEAFRGHIDGLNEEVMEKALQLIAERGVLKVFVDGSNLGAFIRRIRTRRVNVQVITFFHNAESRFFLGAFLGAKTLRAAAVLGVNYLAERWAVRHSDKLVCLSSRDSQMIKRIYGRRATHICALGLKDARSVEGSGEPPMAEPFILFVGGAFYANVAGVEWFVHHVAQRLPVKTVIVGKGFEQHRDRLQSPDKVVVIGKVDLLEPWYRHALLVVAPIFDGSGMKTKVAEALMYGKRIAGTNEAFSGYEDLIQKPQWVCKTADEFVATITDMLRDSSLPFDPTLRALYEEHFSFEAVRARVAAAVEATT